MKQQPTTTPLRILLTIITILLFASCASTELAAQPERDVLIIVPQSDFDALQYTIAWARLKANDLTFHLASPQGGLTRASGGMEVESDLSISQARVQDYRALLILGGPGTPTLFDHPGVLQLCEDFNAAGKLLGAIENAPVLLAQAGLLVGKQAVCWPTSAAKLTSRGAEVIRGVTAGSDTLLTGIGGSGENTTTFMKAFLELLFRSQPEATQSREQVEDLPFLLDRTDTRFAISHHGKTRTGSIYIPAANTQGIPSTGAQPYSLVFGLHGMAGQGRDFQTRGFDTLAQELGFIMVYPDGFNGDWDVIPGRRTLFDDQGLFRRLIEILQETYPINPQRVYVTGHSLGAFMTYRLAQDLSDLIAAAAPAAGLMYPTRTPEKPVDPVSILHLHAIDDWNVPFNGDPLYDSPISVAECMEFWRGVNNAPEQGRVFFSWKGAEGTLWESADGLTDTALIAHPTGGHGWLPFATEQIAEFFYHHPPRENHLQIDFDNLPAYSELGSPVTLTALVRDPEPVSRVVFLKNGQIIGQADQAPFAITWAELQPGSYRLTAYAELSGGEIIGSTGNRSIRVTPRDISQNARARSSSVEAESLSPELVLDGDPYTRWASGYSDTQWLELDLGAQQSVSGLTLVWEAAHAQAYDVQIAQDKEQWVQVYTTDDCPGGTESLSWPAQRAQYIRILGRKRATQYGYSLWDVRVHGE